MSIANRVIENPRSIVDEAIPLPKICCIEHGDFVPVGSAIYQGRRAAEWEEEHDAGFELRDYVMFAHQVGGSLKQLWLLRVSICADRSHSISVQLDARSRQWQIISARPLAAR
jgi:hypothetical protein